MVEKGEISLGVPCAPFTLTSFNVTDGQLEKKQIVVTGRKFPLKELREKLLNKQEKYMRLNTDTELDEMSTEELKLKLSKTQEDSSQVDMKERLKQTQRTCSLTMWHDHATVLGLGMVTITVHILYDPAVFYTQAEVEANKDMPSSINIQPTIESPVIHMLAACSLSIDDQEALVQDRLDCIRTLSEPVTTSKGIVITDKLCFFVGDHPAKQFERGTQGGGTYKCGGCGGQDIMMDNLPHTLQFPWRSLCDLQQVATSGKWGEIPGKLKPFGSLKVQQLKEELSARGHTHTDKLKRDMECTLESVLQVGFDTYCL